MGEQRWTESDVLRTGRSRALHMRDWLRKAEKARKDTGIARRQRVCSLRCKWCFYVARMIAGQAFTDFVCAGCGGECMHPNTATPKLCDECAVRLKACAQCGGSLEWA